MTDAEFPMESDGRGTARRQEVGVDGAIDGYQVERLAVTPAIGHPLARVTLPLKRYASPRKGLGWLITLVRRAVLRLVFPALDDLATQVDQALLQTQGRLQELEEFGQGVVEWGEWVERAMRVETIARESLTTRIEEHLKVLSANGAEHAAKAELAARTTQALEDRLDPALREVANRIDRLDSIVEDEERRREERIARVETATETARHALAAGLAAFGQRLESMSAATASSSQAAASHIRELHMRMEALAQADLALGEHAKLLEVSLTKLDDELTTRIDEAQTSLAAQLDERIDGTRTQLAALEATERDQAARLDAALTDLERGLSARIDDAQVALESQRKEVVDGARAHLESLEASKQEQAARLEQMSNHLTALEEAKHTLAESIPSLEGSLSAERERTKDLSERVAEQASALLDLEQAVQVLRSAATTQLDDIRHTMNRALRRLDEIDAIRREIRELSTIGPTDVETLIEPLRTGLETAEKALHEQVSLLGEQIADISRTSAPRELLEAVAANAARIDRLEEESNAALAAVRRRLQGFPDRPASFNELVELTERFDRFRVEAFEQVADLAQSLANQAGAEDRPKITPLEAEPRSRR